MAEGETTAGLQPHMTASPATLPPLVRRMLEPAFYPHRTAEPIELVQTHISYLFLTGPYAYKVKKPVNLGFVDFATLRLREHFCREELRLNRRGAPGLYLEVLPITTTDSSDTLAARGGFRLKGPGTPVEYALKMRQFPQEALLDRMLSRGLLDEALIDQLARTVADYHQSAPTDDRVSAFGRPERVGAVIEDNYRQTERFIRSPGAAGGPQTREQMEQTRRFTGGFLASHADLLSARAAGGFVRECHGDLHLGNICHWEGNVLLFDCIEFNDAFRCIDVIQDVAFTAMDLEARGRGDLSALLLDTYAERTGDWEGLRVLPLYLCRHAYVRAKVHSLLSDEPEASEAQRGRSVAEAAHYYHLAWQSGQPRQGRLILVTGPPGSGKSTVSRLLLRELARGASSAAPDPAAPARTAHLRSDAVRKHLAGLPLDRRGGADLYTPAMTERTYARLLDLSLALAREGFTVLSDATYGRRAFRTAAIAAVDAARVPLRIVHCHAPPEVLRSRLAARQRDVSDATADLLDDARSRLEPFTDAERPLVVPMDTTRPVAAKDVAAVLEAYPRP